jgi:hypothetical protein
MTSLMDMDMTSLSFFLLNRFLDLMDLVASLLENGSIRAASSILSSTCMPYIL